MSDDLLVALIGTVAVALFIHKQFPNEIVALSMLAALLLTGLLPTREAFSGFSHVAVVTIGSFLVLSSALSRTGVVSISARALFNTTAPRRILGLMLIFSAMASAWMSNTALTALFIPIIFEVTKHKNIPSSKLLLPLSYSIIIGGTFTTVGGSSNIFGVSLYEDITGVQMNLFTPLPFALIMFFASSSYILVYGHKYLPELPGSETESDQIDLRDFMTQAKVLAGSPLIGKEISGEYLTKTHDLDIRALKRGKIYHHCILTPMKLQEGDVILLRGPKEVVLPHAGILCLEIEAELTLEKAGRASGCCEYTEVIVGAHSRHVNRPVSDLTFMARYGASVLGVYRRGRLRLRRVNDILLQYGDILLIHGPHELGGVIERSREFIFKREVTLPIERRNKMPIAILTVLAVVVCGATGVVSIYAAAFTGAVFVIITGCITPREMKESMNWSLLLLIAGLIPFAIAFQRSGLADQIANVVTITGGAFGPEGSLVILILSASFLGHIMQPNGAVALMLPIAVATSHHLGVNEEPFVMGVLFASIYCFASPFSYTTNAMVTSEAGYDFRHFAKNGIPLLLLFYLLAYAFIPVLYPF